jgi:thiol:disulfide interchange protein
MKNRISRFAAHSGLAVLALVVGGSRANPDQSAYTPVSRYDPARDAQKDVDAAVAEAQRTGKRVLLEVGGEWCSWCHTMDRFFQEHADLLALRERNFIMVKINSSDENENQKLLSQYPRIPGYPHLFVLDANGKLLHSQDTSALEEGKSYNLRRFQAFLQKWAPPAKEGPK